MTSRAPDSSSKSKKVDGVGEGEKGLVEKLSRLKQQILDSRAESIREKLEENGRLVATISKQLELASTGIDSSVGQRESENLLSVRKKHSLCRLNGSAKGVGEKENISINAQEELSSSTIIVGNTSGGKCAVHTIKLPHVETIPRYTSWIFIGRNQRMADDQSVLGRRQIYYDQHGSETLICSDSEGELIEPEEEKHNFSDGEDQLLWKALHEHGSSPEVFNILRQFIDATTIEIEERYEILLKKHQVDDTACSGPSSENASEKNFLDKTLASAMDSFDNLFCRRCLVFDCRPHGCSQNLVLPSEKMPFLMDPEDCGKPCGNECYLQQGLYQGLHSSKFRSTSTPQSEKQSVSHDVKSSDACCKNEDLHSGGLMSAIELHVDISATPLTNKGKRKTLDPENSLKENKRHISEMPLDTYKKNLLNEKITVNAENQQEMDRDSLEKTEHLDSGVYQMQENVESFQIDSGLDASAGPGDINKESDTQKVEAKSLGESPAFNDLSDLSQRQCSKTWHPLEKDLYLKGVEIFGKNSCLIARNLLAGLKTCIEVAEYMFHDCINTLDKSFQAKSENETNVFHFMEQEKPARTRILRRRGRARKLKYTWKSAGNSSVRKRIADGRERCKQYVPCECQQMCSKQCPCVENGNCCEKYCGCSKSCKNRFRGCHCAKSQCRSRQCPCFAAGRECDPDVCRNCWVSCGDGSLGSPPPHGDGYQCGNMKLLLKQQQRILLGRSDVAGWGAFIKSPVNKNDYLGEYTGELISHKEADKRGKIYDRANSSFLFDLNDEFVLDACRKGDKLKFANHSSNPNCYAKIMLVAGDHRVGIFAKEHIDASEELFYDYRYGPDEAPSWARKPEGSKKDDPSLSHTRRAHKAA